MRVGIGSLGRVPDAAWPPDVGLRAVVVVPERPEMIRTIEQDVAGYARRHELPPGITGFAQINGRYETDAAFKLGYDLQYLVNWSIILDIQILLRTVWVVLSRRV